MEKRVLLPVFFAAALFLVGCKVSEATETIEVEERLPTPVVLEVTKEPTIEPEKEELPSPVTVFGEVGYVPGVFPSLGGESWTFTDVKTLAAAGGLDTSVIKQEGFTPLAQDGDVVAILAEGANDISFYLVPRLDQAQYIGLDGSLGVATFDPNSSFELVSVYSDDGQVIYLQPGVMTDFRDGTIPLLGREDVTGDVWVLYVGNDGSIIRRAPAFFGSNDLVEILEGSVFVNGAPMQVDEETDAWIELPIDQSRLAEGYRLQREGDSFFVTYQGNPLFEVRKRGLTPRTLENDREILSGLELIEETGIAAQLPAGAQIVLDSEGYPAVLSQGRIAGVFFEGKLLMMPGLERWGAEEIQVVVKEATPVVTSLRGTELYRYEEGEWRPTIGPDEETGFFSVGRPLTTRYLRVGGPNQNLGIWNVGELGKTAETIVKIENPEPYFYTDPLWDWTDSLVVEGVMWAPDGQPTLVKVLLARSLDYSGDITYLVRLLDKDYTGIGDTLPLDEFTQLLKEKKYVYMILFFGLIEAKVPQQYKDNPIYERYRSLESAGVIDFLDHRGKTSPYVMPLLVSGYRLSENEE